MKADTVTLTTSLSRSVKTDFKAHCDNSGLKLNRTLERLIVNYLKSLRNVEEEPRPLSTCQTGEKESDLE